MLVPPTLPELEAPPPPIDERVKANALKKLIGIVRGNGMKIDRLKVKDASALLYTFDGQGFVRLKTDFTSTTKPGKIDKGEMIGSPDAFETALRNMTTETQRQSAKRQVILDKILARPDKGFGARDEVMAFETLTRDFVSHEGCTVCAQTGKTTCSKCGGQKLTTCQSCHARQSILCPSCRGTGKINRNGTKTTCTRCRGRMRVQCPHCQGQGSTPCKGCGATGQAPCTACKTTGWLSHSAHVELNGHLHFNYNRQGMPRELSKLIDAFGSRYAEKKDLDVTVLTIPYDENEPPETIPVGYEVTAPYGDITFSMGKKEVTATLLGWNGDLIKAPPFLNDLTKQGQADLKHAADGQGNVGALLRRAARYRILRETIMICASQTQTRKGLNQVMARYKVGISSETVVQWMSEANRALHIITRRPRIIGLTLGAMVYAGFGAGYFIYARPMLLELFKQRVATIDPMLLTAVIDICVVLLGIMVAVASSQTLAKYELKKTLQGLASPAGIKRIMPKVGWTLWAATLLSLAITGVYFSLYIFK